jgi:hypothetical protein
MKPDPFSIRRRVERGVPYQARDLLSEQVV